MPASQYQGSLVSLAASLLLVAQTPADAAALHTNYKIPGLVDGAQPLAALVKAGDAFYGTAPVGGTEFDGIVFKIDAKTGAYSIVHNFAGADGSAPSAALVLYNKLLYGTTVNGGQGDAGTIFSFDPSTGVLTSLESFTGAGPVAPLVVYNGLLYGTTEFGGSAESGSIFSFNPATNVAMTLYQFTGFNGDGAFPQAALTVLGNVFYGTTSQGGADDAGTIFAFNPATATEQPLYSFQASGGGSLPAAPLLALHGKLYGTASGGGEHNDGTIFRFDPKNARIHLLYSFTDGQDGAAPEAGLIALNGNLYGTSSEGNGGGAVFEINPSTGQETTLHAFSGGYDAAIPVASLIADNGNLLGAAEFGGFANQGAVFSVNIASQAEIVLHNFAGTVLSNSSSLTEFNGLLYGAAAAAGDSGFGLVFAVAPGDKGGNKIYSFTGGPDGSYPNGTPVSYNNLLYGTTKNGGAANAGTIFQIDPATNTKTTLYSFTGGNDGAEPVAGLTNVGSLLFGTTYAGGSSDSGTIFSFNPTDSALATIYTFTGGANGSLPWAPLTYINSVLYGTTLSGGTKNNGVVYMFDPSTSAETTIYKFPGGAAGSSPFAPVIYDNGLLYGVTSGFGRKLTNGTLFSLNPLNGTESTLFNFNRKSGDRPLGGLLDINGILYGTATFDGPFQYGTAFSYDIGSGKKQILYDFNGDARGGLPEAALMQAGNDLYGTTSTSSGAGFGTVFVLRP